MIAALGRKLSAFSERWVPDPFVFALGLTLITFGIGLLFGDQLSGMSVAEKMVTLADGWFADFYGTGLMKFALQMVIVLVTGHAIAMSGPVRRGIESFTRLASRPAVAAAVVALVASLASLVQWGLGAIAGAFMAREMGRAFARRGQPVHYPLLGAAGYAGFMVWHGGLSGSAPLKVAEPGHFLEEQIGVIPITETLLSPLNLIVTGVMLAVICGVFYALMPSEESEMVPYSGPLEDHPDEEPGEPDSGSSALVTILERSRLLSLVSAAGLLGVVVWWFVDKGAAGWNLDSINLIFLTVGLALHPSPMSYVRAIGDGVRGAAGIILQFPFYFGILGILKASGLIVQVADFFVSISSETTFPLFTFLSAGIVNFFVPSGGGQWAVQGPVMMQAIDTLGVAPQKVVMALAYGDAWTNMLQPFWALPLLGIMGLKARDIIGYTAFLMLLSGPIFLMLLLLL
jgi:short-chain fatty acids transporter